MAGKGFFSEYNLADLDGAEMNYILHLRRTSPYIDYSPVRDEMLHAGGTAFMYNGRSIFGYRSETPDGKHYIYLYLDDEMRRDEAARYKAKILEMEMEDGRKAQREQAETEAGHEGPAGGGLDLPARELLDDDESITCVNASWERYNQVHERMGTMALIVPKGLEDSLQEREREEDRKEVLTPRFIYERYKLLGNVEEGINVFKDFLEADSTYVQDMTSLERYTFCNMIALRWYYRILNKLHEVGMDTKFSVPSTIAFLGGVEKAKVNGEWLNYPLTYNEAHIFDALGLSLDQKYIFPKQEGN